MHVCVFQKINFTMNLKHMCIFVVHILQCYGVSIQLKANYLKPGAITFLSCISLVHQISPIRQFPVRSAAVVLITLTSDLCSNLLPFDWPDKCHSICTSKELAAYHFLSLSTWPGRCGRPPCHHWLVTIGISMATAQIAG